MRRYETIVIIDPDLSDEERKPVLERINDLIPQQGGFAVMIDDWGNRKLAYDIIDGFSKTGGLREIWDPEKLDNAPILIDGFMRTLVETKKFDVVDIDEVGPMYSPPRFSDIDTRILYSGPHSEVCRSIYEKASRTPAWPIQATRSNNNACHHLTSAGLIEFISEKEYMHPHKVIQLLNKESGLKGITGQYIDRRDIFKGANKGDKTCKLAINMEIHRIKKYIGAYAAAMNGVDVIVFTAGVGENAYYLRSKILGNFGHLGLKLDSSKNKKNNMVITKKNSKVIGMVIHTNEELMIAKEVMKVLKK